MKEIDLVFAPSPNHNRRRRRATTQQTNEDAVAMSRPDGGMPTINETLDNGGCYNSSDVDYYYFDDDDDDDKGHRQDNEDRIFKGSCSLGQFVLNPCLCLFLSVVSCINRWQTLRKRKKGFALSHKNKFNSTHIALLFVSTIAFFFWSFSLKSSPSTFLGRPHTDEHVDRIPITIGVFEFDETTDIGGWKRTRRFFKPRSFLNASASEPDFGGLSTVSIGTATINSAVATNQDHASIAFEYDNSGLLRSNGLLLSPRRLIHPHDEKLAAEYWEEANKNDPHLHSYDLHPEDLQDREATCRSPSWAKRYYPQCNSIHEIPFFRDHNPNRATQPGDDQTFDTFYISHGHYRDVWVVHQSRPDDLKSVLKMSRWRHDYDPRTFWNTLNDALVMERLTGSPRIVDLYGHCGTAVWVEAIPYEVEEVIIRGNGMAKQEDLHDEDGLKPLNDYTVEEKLDIALTMAESLADLHGFEGGVIVHDDVQLCQWLRTRDGRLKLGDFNRAEVMEFDIDKQKYCPYYNGDCYGNYRSPEEYVPDDLNEAIDVFSFGNNIYALLTGLWVFYDTDDDTVVQKNVINGTRAYIDPRWRERSYIESKMVEVMEDCWIHDTSERIDIFEAARRLREVKTDHERRKSSETSGDE